MNCFFPLCFFLCELFYFCVSFLVNQKCATVSLTLSTRSCWKGAMENITRNTLVYFLSSAFSVSVVMPHQLSANLTRIGHVTHELQLHLNVTRGLTPCKYIPGSIYVHRTTVQDSMCLPIVITNIYLLENPICIKGGVSKQYTTLQECETNFVQGIKIIYTGSSVVQ